MINKYSQVKIYTKSNNLFDKHNILKLFKEQYSGANVVTVVPSATNMINTENVNDEPMFISPLSDLYTLDNIYESFLEKHPDIDRELFYSIDKEVQYKMPPPDNDKKAFFIKYINGSNVLSFKDFSINLNMIKGLTFVHSNPENMGGKSNMFKLFQILMWGKFFKANEYSTYKDIFNRYATTDRCHIEGMISIAGEDYFIRRNFIKKGASITQDFNLYKITEKDADTAILFQDGETYFLDMKKGKKHEDAFYAKNLYGKDANETQKVLKNLVGDIDEFIKVSMFDEFTFNNLLLSQNTERTRVFYNLFLGDVFEKKLQIAKQLYKEFVEKNNLKKNMIDVLNTQNDEYAETITKKTPSVDILTGEIESLTAKKDTLLKQINELNFQIKPIDIDVSTASASNIAVFKEKINSLNRDIESFYTTLSSLDCGGDVGELNTKKSELTKYLNDLTEEKMAFKVDEKLLNAKSTVENIVNRLKSNSFTNDEHFSTMEDTEIALIKEYKEMEAKREYMLNMYKNLSTAKNELVNNLQPDILCPHCNKVISSTQDEINHLDKEINEVIKQGNAIKNTLAALTEKINAVKTKYDDMLLNVNSHIESSISSTNDFFNKRFAEIKTQIQAIDEMLSNHNRKEKTQIEISKKQYEITQLNDTINKIEANKDAILFNEDLKNRINTLSSSVKEIDIQINHTNKTYYELISTIKTLKERIAENKAVIESYETLLIKDKVYSFYVSAHDKDGIVKFLIKKVIPIINDELSYLLAEMDFDAYVEYEDDKYINYYFKRDGQITNLKGISGCERYIVLCALYLINIKFSRLNLSNIIVFDEVFGAIASVNLPHIYGIIDEYRKLFANVFIITHRTDFEIGDAQVIEITKEDNFSTINI